MLNIQGRDVVGKQGRKLYERVNPERVLARVTAPSAILWGQGNKALDTETAHAFIDGLTNACHKELHLFESGGHYINVERPKDTAEKAQSFFDQALIRGLEGC